MFVIKKKFVSGLLEGIVIGEITTVPFDCGKQYNPCAGSSSYVVLSCKRIS